MLVGPTQASLHSGHRDWKDPESTKLDRFEHEALPFGA
jgi:cytochrome P450